MDFKLLGHVIDCAWFEFFFFSEIAKLLSMAAVPSPLPTRATLVDFSNLIVQLFALFFWLPLACVYSVSLGLGAPIWG